MGDTRAGDQAEESGRPGNWAVLIGATESELARRFGIPAQVRVTGGDVWCIFHTPPGQLRVRCRKDRFGEVRAASWTLTFTDPPPTLAGAARPVGLWPAASPDADAARVEVPLVRRGIPSPAAPGVVHSLTATVRDGGFDRLSMFDEPPDWL